jgi:hypothetical protein
LASSGTPRRPGSGYRKRRQVSKHGWRVTSRELDILALKDRQENQEQANDDGNDLRDVDDDAEFAQPAVLDQPVIEEHERHAREHGAQRKDNLGCERDLE